MAKPFNFRNIHSCQRCGVINANYMISYNNQPLIVCGDCMKEVREENIKKIEENQ